ncbi:MAG: glycosyltransferase family 4 protein [bacterium]|nr:glycosyltransferase family 4 protein [bacterium]
MQKILIATGIFPPDIGGPATYGQIIADTLVERGFKVRVITYGSDNSTKEKFPISRISRSIPKGLRHLIYFCRLFFLIRKSDAVLALNATSAGGLALVWARMFKKKFIVRIVGDYAWERAVAKGKTSLLIDDFQKSSNRGFLHSIQVKTCKKADKVIVPSEYLKKIITGWGIEEGKITVVYNAVDFKKSDLSKEEARKEIGIPGNIILSVGRLVPWKGFRMLIKIMPKLFEISQFFRLVIVGDGSERKNLEQMVKNMNLDRRVFIVGKKSKEELAVYFAASDMFVLNSGYEGFSHQILEAMVSGVPVIASAISGNKEVIDQGENGFLVKYNDEFNLIEAIKGLWQSQELRDEFSQKGEETVRKFSLEKMIERTIKVLNNDANMQM